MSDALLNIERSVLNATLLGYVSGITWGESGENRNPYHYMQAEAWAWEHGREQGRQHRARCDVHDPLPPEPIMFLAMPKPSNRERRIWKLLLGGV